MLVRIRILRISELAEFFVIFHGDNSLKCFFDSLWKSKKNSENAN